MKRFRLHLLVTVFNGPATSKIFLPARIRRQVAEIVV